MRWRVFFWQHCPYADALKLDDSSLDTLSPMMQNRLPAIFAHIGAMCTLESKTKLLNDSRRLASAYRYETGCWSSFKGRYQRLVQSWTDETLTHMLQTGPWDLVRFLCSDINARFALCSEHQYKRVRVHDSWLMIQSKG